MTDTTQVIPVTNKPPILVLRERLEARRGELKNALPDDIKPDQFIRALMTSAQLNPDLLACTWQSIWLACMRACRDGLLPDGVDGAIVPYKDKANWIPMYQGLLRRFRRSGQFKWVTANVVRTGEHYFHRITAENGEELEHVPGDNFTAPIERVYAIALTKDGGKFISVLSLAEANKIRNQSRTTREDSPWRVWPEEMYKKTALRRLSKYLPSARDLIAGEDDESEDEAPQPVVLPELRRTVGATAALAQFAGGDPAQEPVTAGSEGGGESGPATEPAGSDPAVAETHSAAAAAAEPGKPKGGK